MTYLVDTNVLSEARRGSAIARDWLRSRDPVTIHLSVLTLGEIAKGIALKARSDPASAGPLSAWLDGLRRDHGSRILPITDRVALIWGRLVAARSRPLVDALIAATALAHDKIVVTRNSDDFADIPVAVINPWAD